MHEAAGEALGIRCHYQSIEVAGADRTELERLLYGVRRLGFAGINVTFPYKEAVIGLLDDMSPGARAIGAVNTVVVREGRLTGHNTDATGFRRAVRPSSRGRDAARSRFSARAASARRSPSRSPNLRSPTSASSTPIQRKSRRLRRSSAAARK